MPRSATTDEIDRLKAALHAAHARREELWRRVERAETELARLTSELAAAQAGPVVEWRTRIDVEEATVGAFALLVEPDGWRLEVSDGAGDYWIVDSGDETGPAGKSAAEAAYRRACGFPGR